jgi:hypothetical protein
VQEEKGIHLNINTKIFLKKKDGWHACCIKKTNVRANSQMAGAQNEKA